MSKPSMKQFRGKKASLWQSAVDRVAASAPVASPAAGLGNETAASPSGRTPPQNEDAAATLASADEIAATLDQGATPAIPPPPSAAAGFLDQVAFCSTTALRIAEARVKSIFTGDKTELRALQAEIGAKFGGCGSKRTIAPSTVSDKATGRQFEFWFITKDYSGSSVHRKPVVFEECVEDVARLATLFLLRELAGGSACPT